MTKNKNKNKNKNKITLLYLNFGLINQRFTINSPKIFSNCSVN